MSKLKELEKRLRDEPDNLGLRVMLAGALHEAGRLGDAVELYRSVAIAYREHGRIQQAITVCRSVLEIAPDDASCQALLATMVSQPQRLVRSDLPPSPSRSDLPPSLLRELDSYPDISGIANTARQISEALIAAARQREADAGDDGDPDDALIDALVDELGDDDVTLPPAIARPRPGTLEDEKTVPRIRPRPRR